MRRRRSSFRKEKAIMLASSCLVLTALTVTGLYVRNQRKELPEENVVDFTALEEEESLTMLGSRTGDGAQDGENVPSGGQGEGTAADPDRTDFSGGQAGADGQADAAELSGAGESADAAELAGADGQADAAELAGARESADAAELARADEPAAAASAQEAAAADSGSAGGSACRQRFRRHCRRGRFAGRGYGRHSRALRFWILRTRIRWYGPSWEMCW